MPAVFSPGEAETRPVDPDAIVYTTGDKVGELLGIAPGEPVLAAANSSATGFYITGTDLREHGFEKDDSIFVFSDLYPLGETFTIGTPVVEDVSGTSMSNYQLHSTQAQREQTTPSLVIPLLLTLKYKTRLSSLMVKREG